MHPERKKQIRNDVVEQVAQSMMPHKLKPSFGEVESNWLYLTNRCEARNAAPEAGQIHLYRNGFVFFFKA